MNEHFPPVPTPLAKPRLLLPAEACSHLAKAGHLRLFFSAFSRGILLVFYQTLYSMMYIYILAYQTCIL